jgi:hypothetical protein
MNPDQDTGASSACEVASRRGPDDSDSRRLSIFIFKEKTAMAHGEMNMMGMMKDHMKACRMCALVPATFGAILFLLGYYLDAEVVRILWLIFSGFIALMGLFMLIMVNAYFK